MMTKLTGTAPSAANEPIHDRRLLYRWLLVFILFGFSWRLIRFGIAMPVWGDEAMLGLDVIGRSYRQLLEPLRNFQVAPIGFLWLLLLTFKHLGVSDYTARLPSLIAGVAGLMLFWQWAKLLVSRHAAVLATGIVAISGYIVRHGVEMKPYAMDFLAALLLLLPATHYFSSGRLRWLVVLVLMVPICCTISYPAIFTAGAVAVALAATASRENWSRRLLSLLYCLILAGVFLAIFRLSAGGQFQEASKSMREYWRAAFPPLNPLRFVLWFIRIHTGNMFAYPVGGKNGASLITTILFGIGLTAGWRSWSGPVRLMLLTPFLLTFVAAALRLYPYGESARVSQHLAPVIILAAGVGIGVFVDAAPSVKNWRKRLNLAAAFFLGIGIILLGRNLIWPYKTKGDEKMRDVIRELLATTGDGPIGVLQPEDQAAPTLRWYLNEGNGRVAYGMTASADTLHKVAEGWVINFAPAKMNPIIKLPRDLQMKSSVWIQEDLLVGPKENGPDRLEIVHVVQ